LEPKGPRVHGMGWNLQRLMEEGLRPAKHLGTKKNSDEGERWEGWKKINGGGNRIEHFTQKPHCKVQASATAKSKIGGGRDLIIAIASENKKERMGESVGKRFLYRGALQGLRALLKRS